MSGELDPNEGAYWNYTINDMKYDIKAFINEIKVQTNSSKVNYVGYSQGTIMMFYGIAQDSDGWWADSVDKNVAVTPCIVPDPPVYDMTYEPVVDEDGNPVIDDVTGEPMYDITSVVFLTLE